MSALTPHDATLVADIRQLIDNARQRVAVTVNAELSLLYWQVGRRIRQDILGNQRAEYGAAVMATLSRQLTVTCGKGWSERQLRNCMRLAEIYTDEAIVHTLCAELSWSHLRHLAAIDRTRRPGVYLYWGMEHWRTRS